MAQDVIGERLRIGINPRDPSVAIVDVAERTAVESATKGEKYLEVYTANSLGGAYVVLKARGTAAAPGNVQQDDSLGAFYAKGYSGSFQNTASMEILVDAAVVAGQRPASRVEIKTNEANANPRLVVYVSREGRVGIGTAFNPAIAATRAAHPLHIVASGTGAEFYVTAENYGSGADENATFRAGRARGTFAAPTTVATGDVLGEYEFWGYTNQWHHCAEIVSNVEGTVVAGTTPDSNLFLNTTEAGAIRPRIKIFSTGRIAVGAGQDQTLATNAANGLGAIWIAHNDGSPALALQRASGDTGSPSLYFRKSRGTLAAPATVQNGDELAYIQGNAYTNAWHDNLAAISMQVDAAVVAGQRPASRIAFRTQVNNAGGPTDRMVIYSGGTVFMASTGSVDTNRILHVIGAAGGFASVRIQNTIGGGTANVLRLDGGDNATTGSSFVAFHRPDGTEIGTIKQNAANTVQYNTTSDARLKENIRDITGALETIRRVQPRLFNFKGDAAHTMHGFIAQELHQVFPEAVSVGDGGTCECGVGEEGPDGKICTEHKPECCHVKPWAVEYSRLVPLLVKAVQELAERLPA